MPEAQAKERVKAFRVLKQWSQSEMAEAVGCSQTMIYRIEAGESSITAPMARSLAAVMRVRWVELVD